MWYLIPLAILVATGYRRWMPNGAVVGWRDRVWVASLVFAVGGVGLIGFIFARSGLGWPDNAMAAAVVGAIAFAPLAACFFLRLPRQAR